MRGVEKVHVVDSYESFQLFKFKLCTMHQPVWWQNKEKDRKYENSNMVTPVYSFELTAAQRRVLSDSIGVRVELEHSWSKAGIEV